MHPAPRKALWCPQAGPQSALLSCPFPEILFGGARGGGKTDAALGRVIKRQKQLASRYNGVLFRQAMPQTDDVIERSKELFEPLGAKFNGNTATWRFPMGGRLRFRPLATTKDADKYQGQNLTDATFEEAGNYADPAPIDRLFGALRGVNPQMVMTANPGGVGQHWLKERFVDPCPPGMKPISVELPNGAIHKRIFIPSKVQDNKILLETDPEYVNRLYLVGSRELVRAWLDGDWNAIEGAFFDCWTQKMVLEPFDVPADWSRFRSGDWGSASPASFGWWSVVPDEYQLPNGVWLPRGAMVRYREWYLRDPSKTNTGLKFTAEQVAEGIQAREEASEDAKYTSLDPSAFAEDGGPSIAERMENTYKRLRLQRADNKRVGGGKGAMGGWDQMRSRMIGTDDGRPMIYCFNTCKDSIRTIPALPHDDRRPEDVDTSMEDHAADEWRYACMSRPFTASARRAAAGVTSQTDTVTPKQKTFSQLVKENAKRATDTRI